MIDGGAEIRTVYNSTGVRLIPFLNWKVNSNRALFEDLGVWVNSAIDAIMPAVSEFDNVIEPDNSGEIEEVDEDGKSSFYFRRFETNLTHGTMMISLRSSNSGSNVGIEVISPLVGVSEEALISQGVRVTEED